MKNRLFGIILIIISLFINNDIYNQTTSSDVIHNISITQGIQTPTRISIDNLYNIYVTDHYQKSIIKYDNLGNYVETIDLLFEPLAIAINNDNEIFVSSKKEGKIYKVSTNSTTVFYTGCVSPSSMTFSPDGLLYIVDSDQKNVVVLNVSATVVQTIGLGNLIYPTSIAYDARGSRIFIGEHGGIGTGFNPKCKVWVYDLGGTLITSFGSNGSANGEFYRIQGITIGKCGNIYVTEPFQANISVFDKNLNYITNFGVYGESLGELNVPLDIVFDSQERILVASMNNSALEMFTVTDSLPTSNIANADATICSGDTTNILVDFTGSAPWSYTYSIDGVNQIPITTSNNPDTLTVSSGGLYEVTSLSDASRSGTCFSGSALIKEVTATPSSTISTGNLVLCAGNSANITVNLTGTSPWSFTYTTNGINPTTITTGNNQYIINTSDTGLYEVTSVSDAACIGTTTGTATLSVLALPTSTLTSSNLSICDGQSTNLLVNLTGNGPWSFAYSYNNQTPTVVNTSTSPYSIPSSVSGTYEITTLSDTVCTNTNNLGSVELVVNPLPTAVMNSITSFACDGSVAPIPVHFTGNAPWSLTYAIDGTLHPTLTNIYANDAYIYANSAGIYTITQIADVNCTGTIFSGSSNISILPQSSPDFTFIENGLDVSFFNMSLNSNSYMWDFGDGITSTLINPTHTYSLPGIYPVTLTSTNLQCGDNIFTQNIDLLLSIENIDNNNFVKIYPNPSSGVVNLDIYNLNDIISIKIFSSLGNIIYNNEFYVDKRIIKKIDLSEYSTGVYNIEIVSDVFNKISKLILYK